MIRAADNLIPEFEQPCWVNARLKVPRSPAGLVLLVHNDRSAVQGRVRKAISDHLVDYRLATCTVGLTKPDEHVGGRMILDVESLADRLRGVLEFLSHWEDTHGLPIAVFGEDICGAAVMNVAADAPARFKVAGSYCGRPDLARFQLTQIQVPTLLVVPGRDRKLLEQNEQAFTELSCASQIAVIGNATRALGEAGAVGACRYLIRRWCEKHLLATSVENQAVG